MYEYALLENKTKEFARFIELSKQNPINIGNKDRS